MPQMARMGTHDHGCAEPATLPPTIAAKPATCPGVAAIALAAAGKLAADQHRSVVQHLAQCSSCQKLRNQLTEQLAAWSNRVLYKGHLIWPNDWSWLRPYEKYLAPDAAGGLPKTRVIDRRFTLIQLARAVTALTRQYSRVRCARRRRLGNDLQNTGKHVSRRRAPLGLRLVRRAARAGENRSRPAIVAEERLAGHCAASGAGESRRFRVLHAGKRLDSAMLRAGRATNDSGWRTSISICINRQSIAWSFFIPAWRPAAFSCSTTTAT